MAVVVRSRSRRRRGALTPEDGETLAEAAELALRLRRPLVLELATAGSDVGHGVASLVGWGQGARAVAACSGVVPILCLVRGPAVSGPALLLGLADVCVATADSFAFLSGPDMVASYTGIHLDIAALGGLAHLERNGVAALAAADASEGWDRIDELLGYLPDHHDALPPTRPTEDPPDRATPELAELVPSDPHASYDVRRVIASLVDDGSLLELRARFAPQVVTALASLGGQPIGVVANQPQALAGTLDIGASQKAARFVRFCDAFNVPLLTLVDTPGFLPGKDLEWRGMIRHGAELAFAYAEATVPRLCLVLRKAYGGAYIVMDSKGMGNDLCYAWPTAEIAVMGAQGAVSVLHRRATPEERARAQARYEAEVCTPWLAAERGYVDHVIEPAETRSALSAGLALLATRREHLVGRKHDTGPL
ncbi:acyl-CoA carboxylase subunit beta, partial [Aciditerrimonas ferrireducens]